MSDSDRVSTGIDGLDDVLSGGLPRNRMYLVQGDPGVGKTTLGLQYLLRGQREGERGLYITLSETDEEIRAVSASHGWDLSGVSLYELSAAEQLLQTEENTVFPASEVELREIMTTLLAEVERVGPTRVVLDSLSEVRLVAQEALRYRRQILALKQYFAGKNTTVLLLDDRTSEQGDIQLQSIVHGVIVLERLAPAFGGERRRVHVSKLRGVKFRGGYHDYTIESGGLRVFPRLVAAEHRTEQVRDRVKTGIPALDDLMGEGLARGTSTLIIGPAGSGKSTLAVQFAVAAAARGEPAALFTFEEGLGTLLDRTAALGIDLETHLRSGRIMLHQIDPAELAPGQFVHLVRNTVEHKSARVVVIDSLNGYLHAMPDERFIVLVLHELLAFLSQRSVASVMVMAQHGLIGSSMIQPIDVSYLADTVVLLRFFEADGQVRKAISVLKSRAGNHEATIREFALTREGIYIGEPLSRFRGVLTGVPVYVGGRTELRESADDRST